MYEHDDETTRAPRELADLPPFPVTARRRSPGEPPRLRRTPSVGSLEERLARLDEAMNPTPERTAPLASFDSGAA